MVKVSSKAPSQRQLRIGEEIRHSLSQLFLKDNIYEPELFGTSITVSEVRISPDLKNATAYVSPLGKKADKNFIDALNRISPQIAHLVTKTVKLRFSPRITFKADDSFEIAGKLEKLIHDATKDDLS